MQKWKDPRPKAFNFRSEIFYHMDKMCAHMKFPNFKCNRVNCLSKYDFKKNIHLFQFLLFRNIYEVKFSKIRLFYRIA